jgi:nucleoside-diphosphate-sugar epimerase
MTVLITGYNGFIGTNLTAALKEHNLIGVDLFRGTSVNEHVNWLDISQIDDVDCMIHLAGKAHDTNNSSHEQEYYDVNVGLTRQIFLAFLQSKASKFIFFSSVKAVADTVPGAYLTEATLPDPQTSYGKSKLQAEKFILEQTLPTGKQVYILRPSMIHGPGNKGNLNLLYKLAKKGLPWPLGAFENKRSFTSMGNLLFVIQQLIEKDIEPGTYQIADDDPLSTNELIRLMADSLGKKAHIWSISPCIIKLLAKTGDMLGLPLNSERLKKLIESYVVSNQKLKNALGIEKVPYTAIDGMKLTLESLKNKNK